MIKFLHRKWHSARVRREAAKMARNDGATKQSRVSGLQPSPVETTGTAIASPSATLGAPQPVKKPEGRYPESRSKAYLRNMSWYRPNRRWRLRWRGNLYGGRRRPGLSDFRRHWVKVPGLVVRNPVLLSIGV